MLLVQYGLGIGVNLYAEVPDADHGVGILVSAGRALTDHDSASLAMGLLTAVALLSYLANLLTVDPSAKAPEG
jgi:hypothetical protein